MAEDRRDNEQQRAFGQRTYGQQAAEDRWDINQQRSGRTSGQLGHQPAKIIRTSGAEDKQDIKQQRKDGTSSSRGHAGFEAAEDRRDSKQQRTGGL